MNWQTRSINEIRLGPDCEDTILIRGRLHDSAGGTRCTCPECLALEQTAEIIGGLLRPGESRLLAIGELYLIVKRHQLLRRSMRRSNSSNRYPRPGGAGLRGAPDFSLLHR
jgi:hypothetical protein